MAIFALILVACGGSPVVQSTSAPAPTPAPATAGLPPTAAPTEPPATAAPASAAPTTAPTTAAAPTAPATAPLSNTTSTGAAGAAAIPAMQIVQTENTKTIEMPGDYFSPIVAVVRAGDTVTWSNKDTDPHSVVSFPSAAVKFDIDIDAGKSGTFTFDKPGVYRYYCDLHAVYDSKMDDIKANEGTDIYPSPMRGVIVVLDKNGSLPAIASAAVDVPATTAAFIPWSLVVPAGTKVMWTNHDSTPHAVVSAYGYATSDISTFVLKNTDGTGASDFAEPGVYYYYCPVHAGWNAQKAQVQPFKSYSAFPIVMDGLIVVTPKQ